MLTDAGDGGLPPCALAEQQGCDSPDVTFQVVHRAGNGLRFLALGGIGTILAEREPSQGVPTSVVLLWDQSQVWHEVDLAGPEEPVNALGIMAQHASVDHDGMLQGDGLFGFTAITLGCDAAGCRLYGVELGATAPFASTALPGGELPAVAVPRGLMRQPWSPSGEPEICVFGEGLWCFDGLGWRELASGLGDPWPNDVIPLQDGRLVAVGDAGRVWHWEPTAWTEFSHPTLTHDLLRVRELRAEQGFLAAGADGVVLSANDDLWVHSNIATDDVVGAARSPVTDELRVALRGGCMARVELGGDPPVIQAGACFHARALPEPVIDLDALSVFPEEEYWRALTPDAFLVAVVYWWD